MSSSEEEDDCCILEEDADGRLILNRRDSDSSDDANCRYVGVQFIYSAMIEQFKKVREHLCISNSAIKRLLMKYKWDLNLIMNARFEYVNIEDFLDSENIDIISALRNPNFEERLGECTICYSDELATLLSLPCGHGFDKDCWRESIKQKLKDTGSTSFGCLEGKCDMMGTDELLLTLFNEEDASEEVKTVISKIQDEAVKDYVKGNKYITKCNGGQCRNTYIIFSTDFIGAARCKCSNRCCVDCGDFYHFPLTCQMLVRFKDFDDKQSKDELATLNLLLNDTKECPSCNFTLEKISGCNHITCSKCRYEFCWLCLSKWLGTNVKHPCDITNSKGFKDRVAKKESLLVDTLKYENAKGKYDNHRVGQYYEDLINEAVDKLIEDGSKMEFLDVLPILYSSQKDARHLAMCTHAFLFFLSEESPIVVDIQFTMELLELVINCISKIMKDISTLDNPQVDLDDVRKKINAVNTTMTNIHDKISSGKADNLFKYSKNILEYDV
uniref:RBR-type E3 ubiquitin transferase n=1 Tax=Rhabditophanes sp. KR3021 TaxID=114890 RepID=A0AC35TVH9_9BILA